MLKYGKHIIFNPDSLDPLNIDRQSVALIGENKKVLEIGCATGFVGIYLQKKKGCTVVGVDLGEAEVKEARKKLQTVIQGNIEDEETIKKIKKLGKFDVVYASALIEHLQDPWVALTQWKQFLKKDGYIVITTSNIAHWSMRLSLLKGNFVYKEYGILDNTHLRFFTTHTYKDLVKKTGYKLDHFAIDSVGGGYPRISKILGKYFPNLFAYQMVIKATPK